MGISWNPDGKGLKKSLYDDPAGTTIGSIWGCVVVAWAVLVGTVSRSSLLLITQCVAPSGSLKMVSSQIIATGPCVLFHKVKSIFSRKTVKRTWMLSSLNTSPSLGAGLVSFTVCSLGAFSIPSQPIIVRDKSRSVKERCIFLNIIYRLFRISASPATS